MFKKIPLVAAVLVPVLFACNRQVAEPEEFRLPSSIVLVAGTQTRTALGSGGSTQWLSTDTLLVYDSRDVGVKFHTSSDGVTSAVFKTENWTGLEPCYALCCDLSSGRSGCAGGILSVSIPSLQRMTLPDNFAESASPSVGKVLLSYGNYVVQRMTDVPGFLRVEFETDSVASFTVEGSMGENLAGDVDVDCRKADNDSTPPAWEPSAGGTMYRTLTVCAADSAASEGCFRAGNYYVSVLPQAFEKGLRIVSRKSNGDTVSVRKSGWKTGLTMTSGLIADFGAPLDGEEDNLPDTVRIDLNFYNSANVNPLGEFLPTAQQSSSGDLYHHSYSYEYQGDRFVKDFEFVICKASSNYVYAAPGTPLCTAVGSKILMMNGAGSWIKVPGVPGRYLKSVTVAHCNGYAKQVQVRTEPGNASVCGYTSAAGTQIAGKSGPNVQTITFPNTQSGTNNYRTEFGRSYYLYIKNASTHLARICLEYTTSL